MKKITIFQTWMMLMLIGLLSYAPMSQAQTREITGNVVCNTPYLPGSTQDFEFTVSWDSPDWEWLYELDMLIPAGFTVNSASDIDGNPAIISGNDIHWDCYVYSSSGSIDFTINMASDGSLTGDQLFDWHIWGDAYGNPPHDVAGQSPIAQAIPSIEGYVLNGGGQTIANATVEITETGRTTTTNPTGYYVFYTIPDGTYHLVATHVGYNDSDPVEVTVVAGSVQTANFTLTAPNLTVSPLILDETLHPNEYLTTYLGLLNTGDGPVDWAAGIIFYEDTRESNNGIEIHLPRVPEVEYEQGEISTGLAPATGFQGSPSPEGSSLRGAVAFGYEAVNAYLMDFDIDNFSAHTTMSPSRHLPDFSTEWYFRGVKRNLLMQLIITAHIYSPSKGLRV